LPLGEVEDAVVRRFAEVFGREAVQGLERAG